MKSKISPHEPEEGTPLVPDIIGLIGVALAVIGMSDMLLGLRLLFLLSSSVCLPLSFFAHKDWPLWIRWSLSFSTNIFLALVAVSYIRQFGTAVH